MTKLNVVIVQVVDPNKSSEDVHAVARGLLTKDHDAEALFRRCYRIADRFTFSPAFTDPNSRTVEWLGGVVVDADSDPEFARCDYFLISDKFHDSTSIHHHLAFRDPIDIRKCDGDAWRTRVNVLHELYWSWNWTQDRRAELSELAQKLDPFVRKLAPSAAERFASRGLYLSLYDTEPELIENWEDVAPALYSLLYLHSEGFEQKHAAERLCKRMAQSTEFFVTFFNPDAILSLSRTYPQPVTVAAFPSDYPHAAGSIAEVRAIFEDRLDSDTRRFEPYDLLPEYPALRYLDLGLLEFATSAKYGQWKIRGKLDKLSQANRAVSTLRTLTVLPPLDRVYYRATAMSILRLPVVRELAERIISEQALSSNEQAIDGMKTSLLNTLVTILTAAAVVIGVVQLVAAVS